MVALDAGLLTRMGTDDIHFDGFGTYEAITRLLVTIDTAKTRAEVAIAQMGISQRSFADCARRGQEVVSRDVVIEKERRS